MLPSEDEVLSYFDALSNWGRWGADDQLGTLNLITPERRLAAASLIRDGVVVGLGHDLDPEQADRLGRGSVMQRYTFYPDGRKRQLGVDHLPLQSVREFVGLIPHGSSTHLDAPSHMSWNGLMYNGFTAASVTTTQGATRLSVHLAQEAITGRGVLLDITRVRDAQWLEPGDGAFPEDLESAEGAQGVRVSEGDVLLLYTGSFDRLERLGGSAPPGGSGYTAACLPWLRDRGVALIGSDNVNDVQPSGYGPATIPLPVHGVGLVAMGLWIVDNVALTRLAAACAARNRWEFFFSMPVLSLVGSTSSPVHPIAVF